MRNVSILAVITAALLLATGAAFAKEPRLKVALTFDDLPLNGAKPASKSMEQITRETVAVLKEHHIPPSFGFINAWKLSAALMAPARCRCGSAAAIRSATTPIRI
jgi:peptidoglycan/xylan/chitin deacetylase (PgdA/CDA1 family)